MKEYVIKEIKPKKYEYGYKIQKIDIELMIELGIEIPLELKEIYGKGFEEEELKDYIYINNPVVIEFIKRQYYIRELSEFSNLNLLEINLLLKKYNQILQNLLNKKNIIKDKDQLNNLKTDIKILVNDILSIVYLKDSLESGYKKIK